VNESNARRLEALTARQTVELPEPAEDARLLGWYVLRGCRTIIGGASGHGKSTLACAIVGAILTGADFLGAKGAGVGPALFVDLEQGLRSVKRMLRESGLADRDDVYIVRAPDGLALDAEDGIDLAELERIIAEIRPVVVVIDPYYKAHRVEANEERPVVDLMRRLDALRERYGFALILPAHVRKEQASNGARKLTLDDIAGSGAVTRGAEVALGLERIVHGFARLRILKDRDGDLIVGEAVGLTYSKDAGFQLKPEDDFEAKAHDVGVDGIWRTYKEWAAALGCRERRAKDLLERLVEAGCFEYAEGPDGRSRNAKCWRLKTSPEARAKLGEAAKLDGQTPYCAHCARVLLENTGAGEVAGVPRSTAPGEEGPGEVLDPAVRKLILESAAAGAKVEGIAATFGVPTERLQLFLQPTVAEAAEATRRLQAQDGGPIARPASELISAVARLRLEGMKGA
jgi:hypothetical protein